MFQPLRYDSRRLIITAALLMVLVVLAVVVAFVARFTGASRPTAYPRPSRTAQTTSGAALSSGSPTPIQFASDAASWDAMPTVRPATSTSYPAIPAADSDDPSAFATAFATELFSRNYATSTREELIGWAQYEDSPLRSPHYRTTDWTKVLVDSLTDLTWDQAIDTPVPAEGPWLALRSERARQTVADVKSSLDPQWEQHIASGYHPPDPMATERDITLTLTQEASMSGRTVTTRYSISLDLQLGTSAHGHGYGVAATNNYVIKQVS